MRKHTKFITRTIVLVVAGCFAACNGTIDHEPNVVLEVATMTIPPVTTSTSNGVCTFTITNTNATFNNKPKNSLATTSPFNDIVIQALDVSYTWDVPAITTPPQTFILAGTIPANGSLGLQFPVINNVALTGGVLSVDGHTAIMAMTFRGVTVSGDPVSVTAGGALPVNSCTSESFGACCTGASSGACSNLTQTDCINISGAVFQGNNTSCATTICPP